MGPRSSKKAPISNVADCNQSILPISIIVIHFINDFDVLFCFIYLFSSSSLFSFFLHTNILLFSFQADVLYKIVKYVQLFFFSTLFYLFTSLSIFVTHDYLYTNTSFFSVFPFPFYVFPFPLMLMHMLMHMLYAHPHPHSKTKRQRKRHLQRHLFHFTFFRLLSIMTSLIIIPK